MYKTTLKRAILSVCVIAVLITCALALSGNTAYAAEKEPGKIITGQRYYGEDRTNLKKCDIIDYIEIDKVPFGMSVQTPSNVTAVNPSYRNHNSLIPNGKIQYEFHKNDSVFEIIKDKNDPNDPTKCAIRIKKAGKIVVTVTKPATKTEEAVTEDITISVVDKRWKSKITGVKSKYVKTYGSKSFTLNAVQSNYSAYYGKYMTFNDWVKAIKEDYGVYNEDYAGYNEIYKYPYFKSDNKEVATVDSKGKVTLKKPGKAIITITVHLRKQFGWAEADGDPGRIRNIPAVKKVTVIVKPKAGEINKVTKVNSSAMKVSWAKKSYVKGYRIKYCTNSKFIGAKYKTVSSSKLSDTVSDLKKGKTYYVKVAAYTTTKDGKKIYGNWSEAKAVKM